MEEEQKVVIISQKQESSGALGIEDAIFAALEQAQLEEDAKTMRPTLATNRPRPASVTLTPQYQPAPSPPAAAPVHQTLPGLTPSFGQGLGIIGGHRFPLPGHPGSLLLPPWPPHHLTTATGSPAEYIGGIVGNLAGVAENTVKLVASGSNALLGVAGHVTCTLNPMCAINSLKG